jgi:galactokinase
LAFRFLLQITEHQLQFTPDIKKFFVLSMLVSFGMICSCQKQDSAVEQQLAQRKAELDEREKALDEREKRWPKEKKWQQIPADGQLRPRTPAAAQLKAERDKKIQQLLRRDSSAGFDRRPRAGES